MSIEIRTPGVHHVALRTADYQRAKQFYTETLGFPLLLEGDGLFIFAAGSTAIGVRAPAEGTPAGDRFDPFRVGLDHVALACEEETEIERVALALSEAGIWNTGAKTDETLGKLYVAFRDPDGIKWELYMA